MADRPDTGGDVAERRSWQLGLAVAIVVLLIFLAGILTRTSPAFESWQAQLPVTLTGLLTPGSLTPAHQRFGARCSTCHRDAFTTVGNDTCVECHKAVAGHRTKAEPAAGNTPEPPCIDCHITHRNKAAVVDARSAPCIDCHIRQEARLAANRDFGKAHAPFRLTLFNGKQETRLRDDAATVPRENSGLKFSHAAHLKADGVSSPEGQTILGCTSCHRPDAAGPGLYRATNGRWVPAVRLPSGALCGTDARRRTSCLRARADGQDARLLCRKTGGRSCGISPALRRRESCRKHRPTPA
jgi:hypothetical protein